MKSKLSKDYEYLYDEVCKGNEAIGLCLVKRNRIPIEIGMFYSAIYIDRGCDSSGTYSCHKKEKTLFLQECERLDVEFVVIDK